MIRIENYGIDVVDHSYSVVRVLTMRDKKTREQKEYLANPRYFPTLQGCLRQIRRWMHYEGLKNVTTVGEAIEALGKIDERFESLIAGIEKE